MAPLALNAIIIGALRRSILLGVVRGAGATGHFSGAHISSMDGAMVWSRGHRLRRLSALDYRRALRAVLLALDHAHLGDAFALGRCRHVCGQSCKARSISSTSGARSRSITRQT